ncbi:MAG: single-stranded-DNA-specific exonuclease RecJ [Pseudomonadota bacterium]
MSDFLNVSCSLTGRRWVGPTAETDRRAEAIAQFTALPHPLCMVLARLGVDPAEATAYLSPRLRDLMPDPRSFLDMEQAARRVVAALSAHEKIAVFADYDVDGGASAALLICWLRALGHGATLYVPDRIDEGYGPNVPSMRALARDHSLILCVDCGTLSHEALAAAEDVDVIVLDHHLGGETLPPALAVVNPNRQDESGENTHLCAAAVVFLMLVEAGRHLREAGQTPPDLMALTDLVALATVADVAPLTGVNRAFVRTGLQVMARRERAGLVALSDIARLDTAPTSYHLGYVLGPRINAGGRVGRADLGARLLASHAPEEAQNLARTLDTLNTERREIEASVRDAALAQANMRGLDTPLVWAADEGWHPGVVGIVAARLKEVTNRPAIVIGFEGGEGKGSGRSVPGVDLGAAIQKLVAEGLLLKGGGHKMAAGLTVARAQLEPAMQRLSELLARQGSAVSGPADLRLDGLLSPAAAVPELVTQFEEAGPFGASAPAPRFALADQRVTFARQVGETHLKLRVTDGSGASLDAIAFGAFDTALGAALANHDGKTFHIAGRLSINLWGGRRNVQLMLDDAAPATQASGP